MNKIFKKNDTAQEVPVHEQKKSDTIIPIFISLIGIILGIIGLIF